MKIKPTPGTGGVLVHLGPEEHQPPAAPEFKLGSILVPVDFSDCSKKALDYAVAFAKQFGARLILMHVTRDYPLANDLPSLQLQTLQAAGRELAKMRSQLTADLPIEAVVRQGNPAGEVITAAKEMAIDLIIISTHGHTGLARALLGSTAEKIVRHAPCPVLVVRQYEREFVPEIRLAPAERN